MPNYCDVSLRIRGRKWAVLKMAQWIEADYSYYQKGQCFRKVNGKRIPCKHHFYRVFETWYETDSLKDVKRNKKVTLQIDLQCAWSFYSCFRKGPFTYYSDCRKQHLKDYGKDFGICIEDACRMLRVQLEAFSSEPGMAFSEHVIVDDKGHVLLNEECDYTEYFCENFDDYEDYLKKTKQDESNAHISREAFEELDDEECIVECDHIDTNGEYIWQKLERCN